MTLMVGKVSESKATAKILIVDDDPLLRAMAATTLRHVGYEIDEAEDGERALRLVEVSSYDLLLLDVMMPGYRVLYGGYEKEDELKEAIKLTKKNQ